MSLKAKAIRFNKVNDMLCGKPVFSGKRLNGENKM
jgi:hypothetical protein